MSKIIAFLSLCFVACIPFPSVDDTTGGESVSEAAPTGAASSGTGMSSGAVDPTNDVNQTDADPTGSSFDGCECDPQDPVCGPGLQCVPRGGGKFMCLAKCSGDNGQGGGYITTCPESCFYPFFDEKEGTGAAYCPVCISCGPVNPLSLVCQ